MICYINNVYPLEYVAQKLPLAAPSATRAGAGRAGPSARAGVDLNKQTASSGQPEACNC